MRTLVSTLTSRTGLPAHPPRRAGRASAPARACALAASALMLAATLAPAALGAHLTFPCPNGAGLCERLPLYFDAESGRLVTDVPPGDGLPRARDAGDLDAFHTTEFPYDVTLSPGNPLRLVLYRSAILRGEYVTHVRVSFTDPARVVEHESPPEEVGFVPRSPLAGIDTHPALPDEWFPTAATVLRPSATGWNVVEIPVDSLIQIRRGDHMRVEFGARYEGSYLGSVEGAASPACDITREAHAEFVEDSPLRRVVRDALPDWPRDPFEPGGNVFPGDGPDHLRDTIDAATFGNPVLRGQARQCPPLASPDALSLPEYLIRFGGDTPSRIELVVDA